MDEEGSSSELLEAPFAVVLLEGLDQLPELALAHDALEVEVPSQSMVGDPVLRIVVGPNALAPIAAADLPAALALLLLGALLLAEVEEPGPQDPHRLGAVLVLRGLVLDRDDEPGRQVGDANRGARFVDLLPARASRA